MFHLCELIDRQFAILFSHLHEDGVLFHLNLVDLGVGSIEERQLVIEVVDLDLVNLLLSLDLDDEVVEELQDLFVPVEREIVLLILYHLREASELMSLVDLRLHVEDQLAEVVAVQGSRSEDLVLKLSAELLDPVLLLFPVDVVVDEDSVAAGHVHRVLPFSKVSIVLVPKDEHVDHILVGINMVEGNAFGLELPLGHELGPAAFLLYEFENHYLVVLENQGSHHAVLAHCKLLD